MESVFRSSIRGGREGFLQTYRSFRWLVIHHNQSPLSPRLETSLHFYSLSLHRGRGGRTAGVGWAYLHHYHVLLGPRQHGQLLQPQHPAPAGQQPPRPELGQCRGPWVYHIILSRHQENSSSRNISSITIIVARNVRFIFVLGLPRGSESENICIN